MTAEDLIELLRTHDPEKPVLAQDEAAHTGARPVVGVDSYEDVLVLRTEQSR